MTDAPDVPDVFRGDTPEVMGSVSLVLWTALSRRLVEVGVLSADDLRGMIKTAHDEFAREGGAEPAMALLARLAMNVV